VNIKKTQTVTVTSKTSNKTLSDTKKVLKSAGLDSATANEDNLDASIVIAVGQFGCSIKTETKRKFSILDGSTQEKITSTSSFEDEADPFYQADCGKQSAKRIKQANEKTTKQAEVVTDLLKNIAKQKVER
tara:strand:+ start:1213 stop:1605 length:393 start_codon:yes stop_codon:yes gene_type:complete